MKINEPFITKIFCLVCPSCYVCVCVCLFLSRVSCSGSRTHCLSLATLCVRVSLSLSLAKAREFARAHALSQDPVSFCRGFCGRVDSVRIRTQI